MRRIQCCVVISYFYSVTLIMLLWLIYYFMDWCGRPAGLRSAVSPASTRSKQHHGWSSGSLAVTQLAANNYRWAPAVTSVWHQRAQRKLTLCERRAVRIGSVWCCLTERANTTQEVFNTPGLIRRWWNSTASLRRRHFHKHRTSRSKSLFMWQITHVPLMYLTNYNII